MANIAIFRINYKSDFILTLNSDAGWMTPFCIKFWTGAPSQAYFVGYDGTTYTHCAPVAGDPTKLAVQFDDHHLPIGDLKFQIGYHFTVADFPTSVEDEVINQAAVIIDQDGTPMQVMLDLNGETAPEIQFSLPAYANEAQRIANEEQRIAHEAIRIVNEESRIANEQTRINQEQTRQQNEQQRINQEQARVNEYASLKADSVAATGAANDAAALANQKAQLAADKAALAQDASDLANAKAQLAADKAALAESAATLANQKAALAQQKAEYAQEQGTYSKNQGDYAKEQGDYSKAQGDYAKDQGDYSKSKGDYAKDQGDYSKQQGDYAKEQGEICAADHQTATADHQTAAADHQTATADHNQAGNDHTRAESDHTQAGNDHTRAESDHTRAESDHAAVEVYVDSLGVFDLSKHNAVGGVLATYADLSAALTALNALDSKYKYGGMSFKFVQTSDNNYTQFRCKTQSFSADPEDWYFDGDETLVENPEFITAWTDGVGHLLFWIRKEDGGIDWAIGIPQPVKDYVDSNVSKILNGNTGTDVDGLNKVIAFLNGFSTSDTLAALLNGKVDKEEGKSLIPTQYIQEVENHEWTNVETDADGKVLGGKQKDGTEIKYGNFVIDGDLRVNGKIIGKQQQLDIPRIVSLNYPEKMGAVLKNLNKRNSDSTHTSPIDSVKPLNILHFSDLHGHKSALQNVMEFLHYYNAYIDEVLLTGDIVESTFASDFSFWNEVNGSQRILNCIGNHDGADYSDNVLDWRAHSGTDCYNRYFANYIDKWGVVYQQNKCYYYKDYPSQNIRLIVLDENVSDYTEENEWLENVLNDALTRNLSVIGVSHSSMGGSIANKLSYEDGTICSFSRYKDNSVGMYNYTDACDLVESFIAGGGTFICWLVGHTHCVDVGFSTSYPNQLQIMSDVVYPYAVQNDAYRGDGDNTECSFSVVSIDVSTKTLRVVKVGAYYDKYLKKRSLLCYDYNSKKIVNY